MIEVITFSPLVSNGISRNCSGAAHASSAMGDPASLAAWSPRAIQFALPNRVAVLCWAAQLPVCLWDRSGLSRLGFVAVGCCSPNVPPSSHLALLNHEFVLTSPSPDVFTWDV